MESLRELVQMRSRRVVDPADREVEILEDEAVFGIARQCGCNPREVCMAAMERGVTPYRYIRNREIITLQEQLRLSKARVSVVGAGGLGGQVILLLARLGIGKLVVVDRDMFDETNLNRQALCNRESLGRSKAVETSRVVKSINPAVDVVSHDVTADSSNLAAIITGSDVVVDALDNVRDRFSLEAVAKQLGLPLIHGALAGFEGQLMTIFPEDPGLRLIYGDGEVKGGEFKSPEAVLGVPGPTPSMVATLQVMEVLKVLLKRGRIFRNVMVHIDLESGRFEEFTFGPPPQ